MTFTGHPGTHKPERLEGYPSQANAYLARLFVLAEVTRRCTTVFMEIKSKSRAIDLN